MESITKEIIQEEIVNNIKLYNELAKPYVQLLAKIFSLKMPIAILNIGTMDMKIDYGQDLPIEIEIKQYLKYLRDKYNITDE